MKNKKIYISHEKSCPKSVLGLTNIPKNTKKLRPPVTFILLHGIGQTLSSILYIFIYIYIYSIDILY